MHSEEPRTLCLRSMGVIGRVLLLLLLLVVLVLLLLLLLLLFLLHHPIILNPLHRETCATNKIGRTVHQLDIKVSSVLFRVERLVGNASVLLDHITTRYAPKASEHGRIIASYVDLHIRQTTH